MVCKYQIRQSASTIFYSFIFHNILSRFKRETEKDLLTLKGPFGIPIFKKLIATTTNNEKGGFLTYHWYKPGNQTPVGKDFRNEDRSCESR